ncbi:MAG: hypothetical protein J5766_00570 [Clostridia bacterium]|nr:hypothetical protein [Clostridia bacterium]
MNDADFMKAKQKAIERMMAFGGSSPQNGERPSAAPPFIRFKGDDCDIRQKRPEHLPPENSPFPFDLGRLDIPFLDRLKTDKDIGLVLGLLLLLLCENTDKLTLIALVYILL